MYFNIQPKLICEKCLRERYVNLHLASVVLILPSTNAQRQQLSLVRTQLQDTSHRLETVFQNIPCQLYLLQRQKEAIKRETDVIVAYVDEVQNAIERDRISVAKLREQVQIHKKRVAKLREDFIDQIQHGKTNLESQMEASKTKDASIQRKIARSRKSLICDLAILYGLENRENSTLIASLSIPDLACLADQNPVKTTAVITICCQFVVLLADYLGLKLPYEIMMPHKDSNFCTLKSDPSISIPLTFDQEAVDGSNAIALDMMSSSFAMLAYDIAWLAWTQGAFYQIKNSEKEKIKSASKFACRIGLVLSTLIKSAYSRNSGLGKVSHLSPGDITSLPFMLYGPPEESFGLSIKSLESMIKEGLQRKKSGRLHEWQLIEQGKPHVRDNSGKETWTKLRAS